MEETILFEVRQSAGTYALFALLGLAVGGLLVALGLAPLGAVVMLVSALWGAFLSATRTRCTVTDRHLEVEGLFRTRKFRLTDIRRVEAGRDRLFHATLIVEHSGGTLVVRDIQRPETVVAVVASLARVARAPWTASGAQAPR